MHTAVGVAPVSIASLYPLIGGIKICNWKKCPTHLLVEFLIMYIYMSVCESEGGTAKCCNNVATLI